jgi:GNAT superfamily N-acetyltransferase
MASSSELPAAASASAPFPALYGARHRLCRLEHRTMQLVLSCDRAIDLVELEQLCDAVGWSRRPMRRVRRALDHSLLRVGLWRHDPRVPRLVGFARCTGDGVLEATIWDLAVHPLYQGAGLGKQMIRYLIDELTEMDVERISLFADPDVVQFYSNQGWELEPNDRRCAFWYAS